jgi:hypothetical protein
VRANGVNLPPPVTTTGGPLFNTSKLNMKSPKFQAALAKCNYLLKGSF